MDRCNVIRRRRNLDFAFQFSIFNFGNFGDTGAPRPRRFCVGWGGSLAISSTALCLCPSAIDPPPISVLLKTKAKPQFDRTVTERSKAFFLVFQGFNPAQFQPCFLVFAVRSAEGRNAQSLGFQFWQFRRFWQFWQSPVALCLCPSARTPPPISVLLKTKVKPQFDRAVTEQSKPFFPVFQGFNRGQFQSCFPVFTVRSAEGRNGLELPFWLTAEC